jgi:hypothetical protein
MTFTTQEMTPSSKLALEKMRETVMRVRTLNTAYDLWWKVFTPEQRAHLGGSFEAACRRDGAIRMWATVHGCSYLRAVIDIAHKLNHLSSGEREWLLRESGELLNADEAFEDAIQRDGLVLNSVTREIYWNGELIKIDWFHEAKWTFIWELARHAKAGLPIDSMTFGENKNPNYVSKMKSELTNVGAFPQPLAALIEVVGKGTQMLRLGAEQIRLFEHYVGGEIREWTP